MLIAINGLRFGVNCRTNLSVQTCKRVVTRLEWVSVTLCTHKRQRQKLQATGTLFCRTSTTVKYEFTVHSKLFSSKSRKTALRNTNRTQDSFVLTSRRRAAKPKQLARRNTKVFYRRSLSSLSNLTRSTGTLEPERGHEHRFNQ